MRSVLKWISLHELQSNILNGGAKAMAGNNAQPSCQTPLSIGIAWFSTKGLVFHWWMRSVLEEITWSCNKVIVLTTTTWWLIFFWWNCGYAKESEQCAWKLFGPWFLANTGSLICICWLVKSYFMVKLVGNLIWQFVSVPKLWIKWLMALFLLEIFLHVHMYYDI